MDWAQGYVSDIQYTPGFYKELSPSFLTMAGIMRGLRTPEPFEALNVCELGCGQGLTTNLLAASSPRSRFWGMDFHPGQIANAQRLARRAALLNVTFLDLSFEDACALPPDALPGFDLITLHGIYSWVSAEHRAQIIRFIGQRLKPGGVVYVSYNCMPGWADMAPVQRLMREFAARRPGRSDVRGEEAVRLLDHLQSAKARIFAIYPDLARKLDRVRQISGTYRAHEYLNENWQPLYSPDVAAQMAQARLAFAASASLYDNIDAASLPEAQRPVADAFADPVWVEYVKDMVGNKRFRRDLFIRGPNPATPAERRELLAPYRFALVVPPSQVNTRFENDLAIMHGEEATYRPLIEALARGPQRFADLSAPGGDPELVEALALLMASDQVVQLGPVDEEALAQARRFNEALVHYGRLGEYLEFLAVPGAGAGLRTNMVETLVRSALLDGCPGLPEITHHVCATLLEQGRAAPPGAPAPAEAELAAEVEPLARAVLEQRLPLWRQLGIQ
ncbi:class I SAM-dependent methyltransferase [Roseomonas sp. BN140053]|uniref:class I SAM-dependent methyltransferase n=1 Tax=Roseomonas sp. BN140053 TaxID=3391898 RepID=UPI0039EC803C